MISTHSTYHLHINSYYPLACVSSGPASVSPLMEEQEQPGENFIANDIINLIVTIISDLDYDAYISSLPPGAKLFLDKQLDWDNEGVDKDLSEIADQMLHWEEISVYLRLTDIEIHDIKALRRESIRLQRCRIAILLGKSVNV